MLIDLGVQIVPDVQTVQAVYRPNWFQSFPTFKTFRSFNIRAQLRNPKELETARESRLLLFVVSGR